MSVQEDTKPNPIPLFGRLFQKDEQGSTTSQAEQLEAALTQRAIDWLYLLKDTKDEHGHPGIELRVQIEIFKLSSDWLLKLRRIRAGLPEDTTAEGVEALKALMQDLQQSTPQPNTPKAKTQPRKPRRDDSGLQTLIKGAKR